MVVIKEIQLSSRIARHDLEVKAKNAMRMLEKKHKVRVVLQLKGRERKELAELIVKDFLTICNKQKIGLKTKAEFKQNKFTVILG